MNLESVIDARLWKAVQASYESRQFTAAILDAIYFVSDLVREKSGIQADGVALAAQAFGGKNPALKVNSLQTESEKNVQSGVESLFKGLYQAVRNPRSHEKATDSQATANGLIVFMNFLVEQIDKTRAIFSKEDFLARVFDKAFVETERYAHLLAQEIPPKQRLDLLIEVFRARTTGDGKKLGLFSAAVYDLLDVDQRRELAQVVSQEMIRAETDEEFRLCIQMFGATAIQQVSEIARLRLENRLIQSIAAGRLDANGRARPGALGTWIARLGELQLANELEATLTTKLASSNFDEHQYVSEFFSSTVRRMSEAPSPALVRAMRSGLRLGSAAIRGLVVQNSVLGERLAKELSEFANNDPFPDDDIPF